MKKTKKLLLAITILITILTAACQDRLIVLWDKAANLACQDSFMVGMLQTHDIVDIVMVIDNSSSMEEEVSAVRSYVNTLSNQMDSAGVDYRFVMISDKSGVYGITVPSPLGTSNIFMHLNLHINSCDALQRIYEQYPNYSHFLRNDVPLNFIIVSDDNSLSMSYSTFNGNMANYGKSNGSFIDDHNRPGRRLKYREAGSPGSQGFSLSCGGTDRSSGRG